MRNLFSQFRRRLGLGFSLMAALTLPLAGQAVAQAAATGAAAAPAGAADATLVVEHAWARPTVPGQASGGGFLVIHNRGGAGDRLLGARADVAERVELHEMAMSGEVMQMRQVDAIDVPAGATVQLRPGGLHVMFMGLKSPLKRDATFPLVLRFENAGERTLQVLVSARPPDVKMPPKKK